MSLTAGSKLGPYEVLAMIGKGGMGEVYRAHDPRTGRDVAIKVSAERFSERFDREVRAVAALNHSNICTLYDVGPNYLVMELVEGESLDALIKPGPLPLATAMNYARQIAAALEEAHEKGVVHRDLKPGNIKIKPDGTVKVLDFGLAKVPAAEAGPPSANSPTLTMSMTQAGVILGTAAYMSPEQARGKKVDRRADIWAFGVVLYEMLTGEQLFQGETVADTLIEVATKQPAWEKAPTSLLPLLQKCLEKDPKKRLRDIGDLDLLMVEAPPTAPSGRGSEATSSGKWAAWGVAALGVVAASALAAIHFREPAQPAPELSRFQIPAPEKSAFNNALLLSPDGRKLAFVTSGEGGNRLWVRSLDTLQARVVAPWGQNPGPFWSPDSRFIVYQENGKLKKVDVSGGPPISLCDAPLAFGGGAWSPAGVIVFGDRAGRLMQVPAAGGVPAPLTNLDTARQETAHGFPSFLPEGRHFVYLRQSSEAEKTGIYIGSIDAKPEQQDTRLLLATSQAAVYTPAPDPREATKGLGFLLFLRDGTLMAQPFDARKLALAGEPVPIAEQVGSVPYGYGHFTASDTGALAYRVGGGSAPISQLTWLDRQGKVVGTAGQPGPYNSLAIAPDGARIAVERAEPKGGDLWLIESVAGGKSERFTFDPGTETAPVWSPDGSRIMYASSHDGGLNLYQKLSNGAGNEEPFFKSSEQKYPSDWSRDGHTLIYTAVDPKTQPDILSVPVEGDVGSRKPTVFLSTQFNEMRGKLSPDGRWLAYQSNESGKNEIYVQPFPVSADRAGKHLISNGGGGEPIWGRDGKELFYVNQNKIMAAEVSTGAVFKAAPAKLLFETNLGGVNGAGYLYDVTGDGQRFLVKAAGGEGAQEPITLVLNWTAALKK